MNISNESNKESDIDIHIEEASDDESDEPQLIDTEARQADKITALQAKLKVCESEKGQHLDDLQRARADFLNARKRLEDDHKVSQERAVTKQLTKLFPLYDSFAMAMSNQAAWEAVDATWRKGMESTYQQLVKILADADISPLDPTGASFDPAQHEAVGEEAVTDEAKDQQIISVVQMGFVKQHADQKIVLRPARVIVGTYEAPAPE